MKNFRKFTALLAAMALFFVFAACKTQLNSEEEKKAVTYTISFDSDGGSSVESQSVEEGGTASKPADPSKDGYVFKGWIKGTEVYDFSTAVTGDFSLKAKWVASGIYSQNDSYFIGLEEEAGPLDGNAAW